MTLARPILGRQTPAFSGMRVAAILWLMWAGLASPALADEAATPSTTSGRGAKPPSDPLTLIQGSADSWAVSKTDAGCYLISPYRKDSSRLAIGRHPKLGLGLFAVSLPLARKPNSQEPVIVQIDGQGISLPGKVILGNLLFIAMTDEKVEAGLRELQSTGALWLAVHGTWIMHGGRATASAITDYRKTCAIVDSASR